MTLVEELYEVWNKHDLDGSLGFFTDDLEYRDQTLGVTFSGKEQLGAFVSATFVAIPDLNFEINCSFANHEHFAGEAIMRGAQEQDLPGLPAQGKPFAVSYALFGDLRDGKISRVADDWNLAEITGSG